MRQDLSKNVKSCKKRNISLDYIQSYNEPLYCKLDKDSYIISAFDKILANPLLITRLLSFKPKEIRLSSRFAYRCNFFDFSIKNENFFEKNHKNAFSWVKPFRKSIKASHRYNNQFIPLFKEVYYSSNYEQVMKNTYNISKNVIRFNIILQFLIWLFKNFFVILQQNKKNKI